MLRSASWHLTRLHRPGEREVSRYRHGVDPPHVPHCLRRLLPALTHSFVFPLKFFQTSVATIRTLPLYPHLTAHTGGTGVGEQEKFPLFSDA